MPTQTIDAAAQSCLESLAGPDAVLRPDQLEAITALVAARRRVLVVQRTGWGKSAVYWIATRLLRDAGSGPTLVVSPLLALMRDQVAAAERMGLSARTVNSTNFDDWGETFADLAAGSIDVLLISPERLNNPRFRKDILPNLAGAIGMLVVDEAHCISDWGHDFRPDYRRIASVIEGLGDGVPVLATTATANSRVSADVALQIGDDTLTLRGPLDRESLALEVLQLPTAAERLAWIAQELGTVDGSGILYCLTVNEAEQVAEFLSQQSISAAAYTGRTNPGERERIEDQLKNNELKCVVATSALGMGYDKGDLAFVIHLGSPSSPIAYYQQVGRAGRAIDSAQATLLPTAGDRDIWDYFDSTAFPPKDQVDAVLVAISDNGPITVPDLELAVNMRRGRLEALLKVLDVEGAVDRIGNGWSRTDSAWQYDTQRLEGVAAARKIEQQSMVDYAHSRSCRMRLLREALDDPGAADCGRCDNCIGVRAVHELDPEGVTTALTHLRSTRFDLEPRKQWPRGMAERKGNIAPNHRAEVGRALSFGTDPGWSSLVMSVIDGPDGAVPEELVTGLVSLLKRWTWEQRPTWICPVPSRTHPLLVETLAERIGAIGKLPVVPALNRIAANRPRQRTMSNSANQVANALDAFAIDGELPSGPVLVVDDLSQSGWTMTVVAELLRREGSGPVLPLVLWKRP